MGFGVWGFGLGVWGLGLGVWGLGLGVWGLGFGVWGFGVWGLGGSFQATEPSRVAKRPLQSFDLFSQGASSAQADTGPLVTGVAMKASGKKYITLENSKRSLENLEKCAYVRVYVYIYIYIEMIYTYIYVYEK